MLRSATRLALKVAGHSEQEPGIMSLFSSKKKGTQVMVGARYRSADTNLITWEVASVFNGIDGTPYAHIFCLQDQSRRKTVAQSSLEASAQYIPLTK